MLLFRPAKQRKVFKLDRAISRWFNESLLQACSYDHRNSTKTPSAAEVYSIWEIYECMPFSHIVASTVSKQGDCHEADTVHKLFHTGTAKSQTKCCVCTDITWNIPCSPRPSLPCYRTAPEEAAAHLPAMEVSASSGCNDKLACLSSYGSIAEAVIQLSTACARHATTMHTINCKLSFCADEHREIP